MIDFCHGESLVGDFRKINSICSCIFGFIIKLIKGLRSLNFNSYLDFQVGPELVEEGLVDSMCYLASPTRDNLFIERPLWSPQASFLVIFWPSFIMTCQSVSSLLK